MSSNWAHVFCYLVRWVVYVKLVGVKANPAHWIPKVGLCFSLPATCLLSATSLLVARDEIETRWSISADPLLEATIAPFDCAKFSSTLFKAKYGVDGALHCTPHDLGWRWRTGHSTSELIPLSFAHVS